MHNSDLIVAPNNKNNLIKDAELHYIVQSDHIKTHKQKNDKNKSDW